MIDTIARFPTMFARGVVCLRIHGLDVEVRSDVPVVIDAVCTSYRAFLVGPGPVVEGTERITTRAIDEGYELDYGRGDPIRASDETEAVLGTLDRIVMAVIGGLDDRGIIGTHAGAVAIDGRAVVLAGSSGAGKSTLTLALLRAGASLLTDELTLIAPDDRTVLPYPRALHVSPATVDLLPELGFLHGRPRQDLGGGSEWSVGVDDLARAFGTSVATPAPLAAIVLLDQRGGASDAPSLAPVSGAEAAIALVRGTPAAAHDFAGTLGRLGGIAGSVPTLRLRATELDRTSAALRDHVVSLR